MNSISNCNITMSLDSTVAADLLAEALLAQAEVNKGWNAVALELARSLKPIDVCAIRMDAPLPVNNFEDDEEDDNE